MIGNLVAYDTSKTSYFCPGYYTYDLLGYTNVNLVMQNDRYFKPFTLVGVTFNIRFCRNIVLYTSGAQSEPTHGQAGSIWYCSGGGYNTVTGVALSVCNLLTSVPADSGRCICIGECVKILP